MLQQLVIKQKIFIGSGFSLTFTEHVILQTHVSEVNRMQSIDNRDFLSLPPPKPHLFFPVRSLGVGEDVMLPSLTNDDPLHVFNRHQLGDSSSEKHRLVQAHLAIQRSLGLRFGRLEGKSPSNVQFGRCDLGEISGDGREETSVGVDTLRKCSLVMGKWLRQHDFYCSL